MTSKPVAHLLADLGVTKSHARPYASTDNPCSEAQFKTLKYRPQFPGRFNSVAAPPASDLVGEIRELQSSLESARAEIVVHRQEAERRDSYARLTVNEVLEYLDAGRQQRGEILRRWEREFASLRPHAAARRGR